MEKYLLIVFILLFTCCRKDNDFKFVDRKTVIEFDTITKIEENRGILTMKSFRFRKYNVYSWSELDYNGASPKWIENKNPTISDIEVPYVIYKRKEENYFYVVKNSDTLKFKIESDQ